MKRSSQPLHRILGCLVAGAVSVVGQVPLAEPALAVGNPNSLPSLYCEFNEGNLMATISVEGLVRSSYEGALTAYQFVSANTTDSVAGTYTFQSNSRKSKQRVEITVRRETGSDGLTTMEYQYAAQAPEGSGVCTGFPQGFVPRFVRNVAAGDALNIRSQANATASIVARVPNDSWIFVGKPAKSSAGTKSKWANVAVAVWPADEDGPVVTVAGYANASFLTTKPAATF